MLKAIEEFMIFAMGISPEHYAKLQFNKEVFENGIEIHICPKCFEQTIDPLQCDCCSYQIGELKKICDKCFLINDYSAEICELCHHGGLTVIDLW